MWIIKDSSIIHIGKSEEILLMEKKESLIRLI